MWPYSLSWFNIGPQVSSRRRTREHEGALPQAVADPLHRHGERFSKYADGIPHDEQHLRKPCLPFISRRFVC